MDMYKIGNKMQRAGQTGKFLIELPGHSCVQYRVTDCVLQCELHYFENLLNSNKKIQVVL